MRKLSAALFALLVSTNCSQRGREASVELDLASLESTSTRSSSHDDPPPPEEEDRPDDGESGGTGTAMAMDEGRMGKADSSRAEGHMRIKSANSDPQLARQQAIEQARAAGILGSSASAQGTTYSSLFGADKLSDGQSNDKYKDHGRNPWTDAKKDRLSTFAADVDTASYSQARKHIELGSLPHPSSVRVEEFVNSFKYSFAPPATNTPFSVVMEAAPSPFQPARHIVR